MPAFVDINELVRLAHGKACDGFRAVEYLTAEERYYGPRMLREYIEALVAAGERDQDKIAQTALSLIREYWQIARSRALAETLYPAG